MHRRKSVMISFYDLQLLKASGPEAVDFLVAMAERTLSRHTVRPINNAPTKKYHITTNPKLLLIQRRGIAPSWP